VGAAASCFAACDAGISKLQWAKLLHAALPPVTRGCLKQWLEGLLAVHMALLSLSLIYKKNTKDPLRKKASTLNYEGFDLST